MSAAEAEGRAADRLPFGPYRGRPVEEVAVMDPGYLVDLVAEGVGTAELRAAAARAVARRGRLAAAEDGPSGGLAARIGARPARPWALVLVAGAALALVGAAGDRLGDRAPVQRPMAQVASSPPASAGRPARAASGAAPAGHHRATPTATRPPGTPLPCGARAAGAVPAASAGDFVDSFQAVEFRVVRAKDTGRVTFLNSHEPYQGHFYVAIFPGDYDRFPEPPAAYFRDRCVVVQGTIELYRGAPQIVLRDPADVRVLED